MGGLSQATRGYLESGGGAAPATIISVSAPNPNIVILEWSVPVTVLAFGLMPTSYTIIPPPLGGAVSVVSVALTDSTHLELTTTDQQSGANYQLNVPQGVVQTTSFIANAATSVFFTGNNVPLSIADYRLIDSTDIIVIYSRPVQPSTATVLPNYVFVPPLTVNRVLRITDAQYLVKTSTMQPSTSYTLTVSDVLALDGSSI
jgi:hypothetical protein